MQHHLTLEVTYDSDEAKWTVGALSRWNGRIELARATQLSPFATAVDVRAWLEAMWAAWCTPTLGVEATESLHDAFIDHAV